MYAQKCTREGERDRERERERERTTVNGNHTRYWKD
jgi:hypothetical protein